MDEVEVDVEEVGLALGPVDDVALPHLLGQRLPHLGQRIGPPPVNKHRSPRRNSRETLPFTVPRHGRRARALAGGGRTGSSSCGPTGPPGCSWSARDGAARLDRLPRGLDPAPRRRPGRPGPGRALVGPRRATEQPAPRSTATGCSASAAAGSRCRRSRRRSPPRSSSGSAPSSGATALARHAWPTRRADPQRPRRAHAPAAPPHRAARAGGPHRPLTRLPDADGTTAADAQMTPSMSVAERPPRHPDRPRRGEGRGRDRRADRVPGRRRRDPGRHGRSAPRCSTSSGPTETLRGARRARRDPPAAPGRAWRWTWPSWARSGRASLLGGGGRRRRCPWRWGSASPSCSATTRTPRCSSARRSRRRASGSPPGSSATCARCASVEARTVLGAAVADDVLGLVILTVVVRIVSEGTVSVLTRARHRRRRGRVPGRSTACSAAGSRRRCSVPCTGTARSAGTLVALALGVHALVRRAGRRRAAGADRRAPSWPGSRCRGAARPSGSSGSSRPSATCSSRCSSSRSASTADVGAFVEPRCSGRRAR